MEDPNPGVKGGGKHYLESLGIHTTLGVCKDEAEKLNEIFIKFVTTKRPFSIIKCGATLDGRIATKTGDSKWVTSEASRNFVHRLRHALDAIMVGINTVERDDPSLTTRLADDLGNVKGHDPTRIILDTTLRISENAKVFFRQFGSDG
jgi:diaminohydroxyphosphoribosylaminopyrimidine deaminase/5-amino-6-(5-phosphoribosylamino)uracil reductase